MLRPPESFTTARLSAQRPRVEDAPAAFAAYAGDPEVTRYLAWKTHERVETLAEFLQLRAEDWAQDRPHYTWLLRLQGEEAVAGTIGCIPAGGKMMFGYVLAKKYWGRGLTGEALRYLVDWTLAQPEYFRAWAFCDVENPASARVTEKAGMTREGVLRRWHVCPNLGSDLRDCIICAKVK